MFVMVAAWGSRVRACVTTNEYARFLHTFHVLKRITTFDVILILLEFI